MSELLERRLYPPPPPGLFRKLARLNWVFVAQVVLLAAVGYVALYAAGGGPGPYANRHALRFLLGLAVMLAAALLDLRLLCRLAWPLYGVGVALLLAVARFGHVGKGAQRWLEIGGFQLQPSELMKIFLVLALAAWFRRATEARANQPLFLIPPALATLLPAYLIFKEPNLGNAVITTLLGASLFFAAGVRWWKFVLLGLVLAAATPVVYHHLHDYQRARITTFLHPESDPLGAGYNIIQSKIALGSGGMWGQGFLKGSQGRLAYLPEKQTDFIFTVIGEEFGFAGGLAVLVLIGSLLVSGLLMALGAATPFGRLVGLGLTTNFFFYVAANVAMVMGAIPVGGVPLPLVSHGGSAMFTTLFAFGLLLAVHRDRTEDSPEED
jgi:rod shape determining protein RodA